MAFNVKGFRTHDFMFHPAATVNSNLSQHSYCSDADDKLAVETANYFLPVYDRLKKGDTIVCSLSLNTTPVLRHYVVTAVSSASVVIAKQDVA